MSSNSPNNLPRYLAQYLVQCNKLEVAAENIRKTIAANPYFQVLSVFQRFDKFRKGYLQPADFSEFMLENNLYPTQPELYLIFRDFDKKKRGIVKLEEFQDQLLPRQNKKLYTNAMERRPYPVELKLEVDLEFLLAKYFQDKMNSIQTLERLRQRMKNVRKDALQTAFSYLDVNGVGYISSQLQLDDFLRNHGKALRKQQLCRIFNTLKFHLKSEQQVTKSLFRQHIDPFHGGQYQGYRQKMYEKQNLQKKYISRKYQLQNIRVSNVLEKEQLDYELYELSNSNRRLREIMDQQDYEQELEFRRWRFGY